MSESLVAEPPDTADLGTEPWVLREATLDLAHLAQTESLFALSNGFLGLRGNLDEGEPSGVTGTYLAGFFEHHPLPYPEGGYGYPEAGQQLVDVTDGKIVRLLVDDEPFDVRTGRLERHERVLDLRAGTLTRDVVWVSPGGRRVGITATRLVSFARRTSAAVRYEVCALDGQVRVVVQSELVANDSPPDVESDDPRVAEALSSPLEPVTQERRGHGATLVHRTRSSELVVACGADHQVEAPGDHAVESEVQQDLARTTVVAHLGSGEQLTLIKHLAYAWSDDASPASLRDVVAASLTSARSDGWQTLVAEQRAYLADFWRDADVEIDGDAPLQQAVRFCLFQVLQAGARAQGRPIGAKGLTGSGYNGHTFWDIEGFVLPVLAATRPDAAAAALRWRASTLDKARARAKTLRLAGAAFPWRTIDGSETSAYWPAGTAAFHIDADIAYAFERYRYVTGDEGLERDCGLEVLVETARLWMAVGHHDRHGGWHVDGVTGPDEYTAVIDDNVFTNLMAARALEATCAACDRHPELAAGLGVSADERDAWARAAQTVHVPFDDELGVHAQCEDFTRFAEWDFDADEKYPLMLHAPYFELYRKQVVKQADLVLAMHWLPERFDDEQVARNLDYYERRTVRDSSLSAGSQAVVCARAGHMELAHQYLHEAALVDLRDLQDNVGHGLHLASLGSVWVALVEGFGGLWPHADVLRLAPALPPGIDRLAFRMLWRGSRLCVEVTHQAVEVSVLGGDAVELELDGERVRVEPGTPQVRPVRPRTPLLPTPQQPPGREPRVVG